MVELAQFPLQSVHLPGMPLGLHIFEPRYVQLLADLDGDNNRFGVVLITRGSEVGGDDQRALVGTAVQIDHKQPTDDGRWLVEATGVERFVIRSWLPDDPYPRAEVDFETQIVDDAGVAAVNMARQHFREIVSLVSELGADTAQLTVPDDPVEALYRIAAVVPIADYDRYEILAESTLAAAADTLCDALAGMLEIVQAQLGGT